MHRLLLVALRDWWHFEGYAVAHGGPDLNELDLGRFCSYVRWFCCRNMDEPALRTFEEKLFMPPKGVIPTVGPWTAEAETEALQALQLAFG